jgi:hypothetical protein
MTSTFEQSFMDWISGQVNDASFAYFWSRTPQGAPVEGRKEVVFFYAPGGDKQALLSGGMSTEEGRKVQVSIFSINVQDVKDAALTLHNVLDGANNVTLADGTKIFSVVPGMQDIDSFDDAEKVFQTVFDVTVRKST